MAAPLDEASAGCEGSAGCGRPLTRTIDAAGGAVMLAGGSRRKAPSNDGTASCVEVQPSLLHCEKLRI